MSEDGGPIPDGGHWFDGGPAEDGGLAEDGGPAGDGGPAEDGGPVADGGLEPPDGGTGCDNLGYSPELEWVHFRGSNQTVPGWYYSGHTTEVHSQLDSLMIRNLSQAGGQSAPGTYQLTSRDSSYFTCGFCLILYSDCNPQSGCRKIFMPRYDAGNPGGYTLIQLGQQVGESFAGKLNNVVMQQVTLDYFNGLTIPVPGGETWCLGGYTWKEKLCQDDSREENDKDSEARSLSRGTYSNLTVCTGESDHFKVSVPGWSTITVTTNFIHRDGDLNLEMEWDAIVPPWDDSSWTDNNSERVSYTNLSILDRTVYIQVFGYLGASNSYRITIDY